MADNRQSFDFSGLGPSVNGQPVPQKPLSKVDSFKKNNFDDGTKVGGVEGAVLPFIGKQIEKAQKGPLGFAVNPALRVMENLYTRVIQPAQRVVTTAALLPEALEKQPGGITGIPKAFQLAVNESKNISMGQAVTRSFAEYIPLPESMLPTVAKESFDIFDQQQRDKAFRDEFFGIVTSGSTDLAINGVMSKITGAATKAAMVKVRGTSRIVTEKDMQQFSTKADEAVAWADAGKLTDAPSGLAVYMDDAVRERNVQRLQANPLIAETNNPLRTATIVSRIDNHLDLADYLKAERGDAAAFDRFFQKQALSADHLDNYGFKDFGPVSDWSKIHDEVLTENLAPRYQAIINDLKGKDRNFAAQLDDWASKANVGDRGTGYVPGRFGMVESVALSVSKVRSGARFGSAKIFGDDPGKNGWRTKVYQSSPYDRVVRVITWAGDARPQGYINISNPRKGEAVNDVLSELNRLQFLKGKQGEMFKRQMAEKFLSATTNSDQARVLVAIEKEVMLRLAKQYNVRSIGGIGTDAELIKMVEKLHAAADSRRTTATEFAQKQGLIPDEDGSLNIIQLRSQTTEVNNVPMLDFRKLEMEVILGTQARAGVRSGISKGTIARTYAGKYGMAAGQFFDIANMVFNNLNLLRVAYIPKNAIIDPFMRGSMALESSELVRNAIPGFGNMLENSTKRTRLARRYVPGTASYASRKAEQAILKDIDVAYGKLNPLIMKMEATAKVEKDATALWQTAKLNADKAEAALKAASPSSKAAATAAKHEADYKLYQAQLEYTKFADEAKLASDAVTGLSILIEKNRSSISGAIRREGDLLQRKYIGKEADVITVDGKDYNIKGLGDPNVRGTAVYLDEIDSASSLYSKLFESEASMNVRARSQQWVKIQREDGKAYYNAIAHVLNRQIRQELDMPLGMMLRGESDQAILNFLYKTEAGKEYRRRMSSDAGRTLTQDDFLSWTSETSAYLQKLIPSDELRRIALERPVTVKEVENFLKSRPDLLPEIDGPNVSLADLSKGERLVSRVANAQGTAWRILGAAENKLVRNPMFMIYAKEEMEYLIKSARRTGVDPSDAVVNHQFRQIAMRNAVKRIEDTLYSSRRLTNGMYTARYAMAFPMAFFNSQAVALKLMAKNPMNAYWYNSIQDSLSSFEPYTDQEGNTYKSMSDVPPGTVVSVSYPIPANITTKIENIPIIGKAAAAALSPYTDPRGGGLKWNPKQMEFMIADPSVAWFGSVLVSSLIKGQLNSPLWKTPDGEKVVTFLRNTFGNDFYENSILYGGYVTGGGNLATTALNAIKPAYLESLFPTGERYMDQVYTNWQVAYAQWHREGRVGNAPTMEQAGKAASNLNLIKAIVQFNMPISTTFDPVTRSAKAYYADLLEKNKGDYAAADRAMMTDWGIDGLAFLGSHQKNIAGVASTVNDIKMIRSNRDLLASIANVDPLYARMMSSGYGDLAVDYSTEVAEIYKNLNFPGTLTKLSRQKTEKEIKDETDARLGWVSYNFAVDARNGEMAQYGINSTQSSAYEYTGVKRRFDERVADIKASYPGWINDRTVQQGKFWDQTFPTLKKIANDPVWRKYVDPIDGGKWAEISYWIGQVENFRAGYGQLGSTTARDQGFSSSLNNFHYKFVQGASDGFAAFAARWLESMPELDIEKVAVPNG